MLINDQGNVVLDLSFLVILFQTEFLLSRILEDY